MLAIQRVFRLAATNYKSPEWGFYSWLGRQDVLGFACAPFAKRVPH
jgi:hypothetical protein